MPEKDHISFTEKIMRETSRRYCPIYSIRWAKSEPIEIEGKIIPKGEFVVGTFPTVHFDPDLWPEPEKVL
jgi:cytochrome P450